MTAEEEASPEEDIQNSSAEEKQTFPTEITEIFEFLSSNEKIVFKSQQIDDPDLNRMEKVQIAQDIFQKNRQTFLQRFGSYFEEQHLNAFGEHLEMISIWKEQENVDEIKEMLLEYRRRLQTHKRDVKNRRYTAMQQLIKQGDYFSELEMMNRAPELYQELVGQYLSEAEIKQRDSYDVKNTTFSGILMHSLEQQQRDEMLKEANEELKKEQQIEFDQQSCSSKEKTSQVTEDIARTRLSSFEVEEDEDSEDAFGKIQPLSTCVIDEYEVPQSCRKQWGNFDNENIACSTSQSNKKCNSNLNTSKKYLSSSFITAGERNLLRQEFVGIMHERFLAGNDTDFDYSLVDENTRLDDLSQLNQDKEDAYFDTSDDDANEQPKAFATERSDTESEDELDLYMRHLNQHHSLKT